MFNAYISSSCTSCRKTEAALIGSGTAYTSRDHFTDRFTKEELSAVITAAGISSSAVLSGRSKLYDARQEEIDALSHGALRNIMIEEPTLIRRPIVIGNGYVVVGYNTGQLAELIARSDA